jgi:alpha-tubulin suppressor-like RCC1 family protein
MPGPSRSSRSRPSGLRQGAIELSLLVGFVAALVPSPAIAAAWNSTAYWGFNAYGQGDGQASAEHLVASPVPSLTAIKAVSAGAIHSVALKDDGTVLAWGDNTWGQLGVGTTTARPGAGTVTGLSGVTQVSAGYVHTIALKTDGTVWAWGFNAVGTLGNGTTTDSSSPVQVAGLDHVVGISAGFFHNLAVKDDGTVWAWGFNVTSQLGDGTASDRWVPVRVIGLTGINQVAAGGYHSLAIRSDGTVWAWGFNGFGELGDGTTNTRASAIQVPGLSGASAVSAGYINSMFLRSDRSVWAWGSNVVGQVGDNSVVDRLIPVSVMAGASAISSGYLHSLALKTDGTAWAWGYNAYGQLGDGTNLERHVPVRVQTVANVTGISAGQFHSLAIGPNLLGAIVLPPAIPANSDWLTTLNYYRAIALLPPVLANSTWSDGDYKHSRYIAETGILTHSEDPANPWYTPEGNAAGNSGNVEAGLCNARPAVDLWMASPFHAAGMIDPGLTSSGFGLYQSAKGGCAATLDVLRGRLGTPPVTPVMWPGPGTTVPLASYPGGESPNPLSGCPGYATPTGLPILVLLPTDPSGSTASVTQDGVAVPACVFDGQSYTNPDPATQSSGRNILTVRKTVMIIPRQPLRPGSTYTVGLKTGLYDLGWSFRVA